MFVSIPGRGEASAAPFRCFLSHRQTLRAIKLKLSDFVGTFIVDVHILAKKKFGLSEFRSPEQITWPDLTCSIVEVWSRAKAKLFFRSVSKFQSFFVSVTKTCISRIISATWGQVTSMTHYDPRPAGGGHILPLSRIFAIIWKLRNISPPNFQYLIGHHFYTLPENFVKFGWFFF